MIRRFPPSIIDKDHPDYSMLSKIRDGIYAAAGGAVRLHAELPSLLKEAVDFVLDPAKTGRTSIADLDKVEKTFIGLKVEHFLRDKLGAPKGLRRDLQIDGQDVDIKNTIGTTWMIPPETYQNEEPCLLIATAKFDGRCWLGILLARENYLGAKNRDGKKSVTAEGKRNILWLVEDAPYPASAWAEIDMARFRELRQIKGGKKRAAQFFRENLGKKIDRSIVELNRVFRNTFAIVDGIVGMEGNGPIQGASKQAGVLVIGRDLRAVDATCCRIMGIDPAKLEYLATSNGIGNFFEADIEQRGEAIAAVRTNFKLIDRRQ